MAQPGDVVEAPLFGARATFLDTTEQTNGELLRVEVVLPPGFSESDTRYENIPTLTVTLAR